jgi:hypothetical protein
MIVKPKLLRRTGRKLSNCDLGILRAAESVMVRNFPDKIQMPLLAVCGAPRSGHTLAYQVITHGLQVFMVNNFQYVFYRTPLIGYFLSKVLCRPNISDFRSEGGYIPGLNGPHEGALIWKYWCDMSLKEQRPQPDPARVRKFGQLLNKIYSIDGRPYCDSWLGHALYFQQLQGIFPRNIIIRCRRALLSTALSIAKYTRNLGKYGSYWSVQPRECEDPPIMSQISPYERIARQVYVINRRMDEQAATGRYTVFDSEYISLCEDPRGFVSRLRAFAETKGIILEPRTDTQLPARFTATKAHRNQNEHTRKLALAFDALLDEYGPVNVPLEPA